MAESITMTTEQKAPLSVHPTTAAGNPAPVQGAVTYTVTPPCTIQAIDALTAFVVSGATPGDSTVTASGDADLGAGVVTITDTIAVHVVSPLAQNLGLEAGAPVLK